MDIRTKLVFVLAAVTLGSMLAFGAFMYRVATNIISEGTQDQLASLAESGADALTSIVTGWRERVLLVSSRTQLRLSLAEYDRTGDEASRQQIRVILGDATDAAESVTGLAVYDRRGTLVVRVGDAFPAEDVPPETLPARATAASPSEVLMLGVLFDGESARVPYVTPLELEGRRVGFLYALLTARRLADLTGDYTGLGETGELLIVVPDSAGAGARTLHPVREPGDGDPGAGRLLTGDDDPAVRALAGEEDTWTEGLVDYRGESVWAATRYLEDTGWGLAVKFDSDEKAEPIRYFREEMVALALSLAGICVFVAFILGFRFATPIHDLAGIANRIREGDLDARAEVKREDEIGLLARTFNQMADELEVRVEELHEFQKFFELSLNLLCIAGTDGYFKRVNPAFTRALGWDEDRLLGSPFLDLVHPDDKEATQAEIDKLSQGIPTINFVNRFECTDGSYKWLRWTSHPEPETGLLYAIAHEIDPAEIESAQDSG